MTPPDATDQTLQIAGLDLHLLSGGSGDPAVLLHHSIGGLGWTPFHKALAQRFHLFAPDLPGYGESQRPEWARDPRDLATLLNDVLERLELQDVTLIGLGFGGYLSAEMAVLNPGRLRALVLVGAAGLYPSEGEILDQMLVDYADYVRAGFHDPDAFTQTFGDPIPQSILRSWQASREMTARVAWRPYMFDRRLPSLLTEVRTPTLVVWGDHDRVVPPSCAEAYAHALPNARRETVADAGHLLDLEKPEILAGLIATHAATP